LKARPLCLLDMLFLSHPGSKALVRREVDRLRAPRRPAQQSTPFTTGNGAPNLCSTPPWGGFFTNAGGMRKRRPPDRRQLPYHKMTEFQNVPTASARFAQEPLPGLSEKYFS